jgi:hypothetical protein
MREAFHTFGDNGHVKMHQTKAYHYAIGRIHFCVFMKRV